MRARHPAHISFSGLFHVTFFLQVPKEGLQQGYSLLHALLCL